LADGKKSSPSKWKAPLRPSWYPCEVVGPSRQIFQPNGIVLGFDNSSAVMRRISFISGEMHITYCFAPRSPDFFKFNKGWYFWQGCSMLLTV
jgi:hypothetical protein